jgi:hypothetical protein
MSLQSQPPYTTPSAINVVGVDATVSQSGRDRISTRPGLTATGGGITEPYAWCEATWVNSGLKRGIAVTASGGTYTSTDGANWTEYITTAPGSDFASCDVYLQNLFQATGAGACRYVALTGAAGAGTAIGSHPSVAGTPPTNCGVVCAHLDRLWLAGDTSNPHVLYASRIAQFYDWDYAQDYGGAQAWASSGAEGGQISEPIVGLTSHTRDCLICHCTDSCFAVRGNPITGEVARVSHYVGALSQSAWTHDSAGNLWFMSRDGLYRIPAGCGDQLTSISREALPDDLVAINPGDSGTYCSVSYDPRQRCLWIFVDKSGSDNDVFWSFDLQAPGGGWWQHTFSNGPLRLGATLKSASTADKSALIALNASGTAYQFDRDSTESFSSHCVYGPFQLGGAGTEGMLHAVQSSLGSGSSPLSWTAHGGATGEAAVSNAIAGTARFTGSDWPAGLSSWQNPRMRDAYGCIKVFGTTTDRWSQENIDAQLMPLGLRRVA